MGERQTKARPTTSGQPLDFNLQDITDGLEDEIFIVDRDFHVKFSNAAAIRALGNPKNIADDKHCYQLFENRNSPCGPPLWTCPLTKTPQITKPAVIIHPRHPANADATAEYSRITMYPLKDHEGNVCAIVETRRDVSTERKMEQEVFRRHHHLHALSRISNATSGLRNLDAILNVCLDVALEAVNGEIGGILLLDEDGQKLHYSVSRGLSAKYAQQMKMPIGQGIAGRVAKTGEPVLLEDISRDPHVARSDLVSTEGLKGFASVPLKAKEKVVGVMNMASHVPGHFSEDDLYLLNSMGCQIGAAIEQAKLYQRLASAAKRYQTLLQHALTAQEDERKRIARELHDETSQAITSLTLSLQAIIELMEMRGTVDSDLMERLKATHVHTVHTGSEIVKLMKELRPTLLDELGMPTAIHRYAKDTLQTRGINISAEFTGTDKRFPPEIEVTLFRVAQGLIGNIMKHAEAKNTSIRLECNADKCALQITDDGKGFDVSKLTRVDPSGRGAGLFTIKERVKLVGGHCKVNSRPGQGTKVTVNIPIPRDTIDEKDQGTDS
ncbi:MAG: GAF domain-containing protein [Chloroflexi bacterium]|nr:GAF domain-containing protein [Chloroflexota bacterium]MBM3172651.1 GAF domain-containing protein [Chloroflexota bacterium]MBM3175450.1 GAF domain-containing protein [Chloroflexota bacterium]MBM4451270.1 GAF domain-containing protein [Chloroflexota bacterium]